MCSSFFLPVQVLFAQYTCIMGTVNEVQVHFLAFKTTVLAVHMVNQSLDVLHCCSWLVPRTTSIKSVRIFFAMKNRNRQMVRVGDVDCPSPKVGEL